nr:TOBE domain-containing protein [Pseudomonas mendocina]
MRVLARDVSLAEQPGRSSIQNVLRGQVDAIGNDEHPGLALVRVRVGDAMLLARLTKRAVTSLSVTPGQTLWVQVKSVALIADSTPSGHPVHSHLARHSTAIWPPVPRPSGRAVGAQRRRGCIVSLRRPAPSISSPVFSSTHP